MAAQNMLIMNLLRLITPEEIGDIATSHNGGKFLSLIALVNERIDHKVYRDFSSADSVDIIHESHSNSEQAKILPFDRKKNEGDPVEGSASDMGPEFLDGKSSDQDDSKEIKKIIEHEKDENMSSFILIEKARLLHSQKTLKQKEIISLYRKNSTTEVEQIKNTNNDLAQADEDGVLINKKHY